MEEKESINKKSKLNIKEQIANLIIILLFVFCCLFIGYFHEPWSDEAQSWLIAREEPIGEIFFYNSRYEGTFPLWTLILKLFINFGLEYQNIYIVSTIISTIGICILLYKTNLPKIIKYLLPFSFFVLYQYTVVARNYSLFIIAFAMLLWLYEKRHENVWKYFSCLILFSMISLHGMIISGALTLLYFLETIKKVKTGEKINKNKIICFVTIFLLYCFEVYILIPPSDLIMDANYENNFSEIICDFIFKITTSYENPISITINSVIISFWIILILKNKESIKNEFLLIEVLIIILFLVVRCASHHLGILFFIILTKYLILNKKENTYIISAILVGYIILTLVTGALEVNYKYSGAKEMAEYIKTIEDYENKDFYGIGYKCVALLPYFEKNIYSNINDTYYLWSSNNLEWMIYKKRLYKNPKVIEELKNKVFSEYVLLEYHDLIDFDQEIKETIEESGYFELVYETEGKNFYKGNYSETESYFLYKLKENV